MSRKAMTEEERQLVDSVFHPDGRCTCAGEGKCEWCRTHCVQCGRRVEHVREYPAYQAPTCYKCLPPPPPLPVCNDGLNRMLELSNRREMVRRNMEKVLTEHPEYVPPGWARTGLLDTLVNVAMECIEATERTKL